MAKTILIVDDEADIRNLVKGILEDEGYNTALSANSKDAYEVLATDAPDLVVLDIWLQGSEHDGLEILSTVKNRYPDIPVIMISGHGTIETAVAAIKKGAYDFIEKPFKADRLLMMVRRALEAAALMRENRMLKRRSEAPPSLVGESPFSKNLDDVIKRVATTNSRVLLTGEAGTGKDIVARMIHSTSKRAHEPFMILNCATLLPDTLETALFGADGEAPHIGVLESVDKGTLLLDEVGDMPLETQAKIIRVLQEQRFKRVGGNQEVSVDVRIMATSHRDLEQAVKDGTFREDLYYRLNVVPIVIPPLRERKQDVAPLVEYFLQALCKDAGVALKSFTPDALKKLSAYEWPGNVRQLRNVLEWVVIMYGKADVKAFGVEHLPPEISGKAGGSPSANVASFPQEQNALDQDGILALPLRDAREKFEREYLFSQVERFEGNISKTAEFIGMERSALHRKLKTLQQSEGQKAEKRA